MMRRVETALQMRSNLTILPALGLRHVPSQDFYRVSGGGSFFYL
jgi:hypothetical protein